MYHTDTSILLFLCCPSQNSPSSECSVTFTCYAFYLWRAEADFPHVFVSTHERIICGRCKKATFSIFCIFDISFTHYMESAKKNSAFFHVFKRSKHVTFITVRESGWDFTPCSCSKTPVRRLSTPGEEEIRVLTVKDSRGRELRDAKFVEILKSARNRLRSAASLSKWSLRATIYYTK